MCSLWTEMNQTQEFCCWGAPALHYILVAELELAWVSLSNQGSHDIIPRRAPPDLATLLGDKASSELFSSARLPCFQSRPFHLSSISHFGIIGQIGGTLKNTVFSYSSCSWTWLSLLFQSMSELSPRHPCLLIQAPTFSRPHTCLCDQVLPLTLLWPPSLFFNLWFFAISPQSSYVVICLLPLTQAFLVGPIDNASPCLVISSTDT